MIKRRSIKVEQPYRREPTFGGIGNGDEVRVEGFKGLHVFLNAVYHTGSNEVDHLEVLLRGHLRSFPVCRVKNRFGHPLVRKEG